MMKNTVLFVDDQEEILFLIKRMLKDEPYDLLFANSAAQALEIIEVKSVDVIVTDVLMPVMGGLELLDIVQKKHPKVVRIILSGFSQIPTLLTAINRGKIFRYITKPWEVDEEAKEIIREAIDYGRFMGGLSQAKEETAISMEVLAELIEEADTASVITKDGIIAYIHPKLVSYFNMGQPIGLETKLDQYKMKHYELSKEVTVYKFSEITNVDTP